MSRYRRTCRGCGLAFIGGPLSVSVAHSEHSWVCRPMLELLATEHPTLADWLLEQPSDALVDVGE